MIELINILWEWKKWIIGACFIAAIAGVTMAYMLPVYYQSTASFMVANPILFERNAMFQVEGGQKPIYQFGGKPDINRVFSIASSSDLSNYLIEKYKLYEHYDIDQSEPLSPYYVSLELGNNFKTIKNEYGAVEISVMDKDKNLAAQMANDIMYKIDEINARIIFDKQRDFHTLFKKEVIEKKAKMNELNDSLRSLVNNNPKDTMSARFLREIVESAVDEYNDVQLISNQYNSAINQKVSTLYVLEEAYPALRKAKPIRWMVVASFLISTLLISAILVVLIEKFREYNQEQA